MKDFVFLIGKGLHNQRTAWSIAEVAEALGFTKWQVRRAVRDGKLRRAFGPGKYGFDMHDVQRFLNRLNQGRIKPGNAALRAETANGKNQDPTAVQPKSPGIRVDRASARGLERAG